jgi:hypothetical protein
LTFKPSALTGYYKYTDNNLSNGRTRDTALLELYVTRWNSSANQRDTLGTGAKELWLSGSFSAFSCPVTYTASGTPDSILIRFQPSKFGTGGAGACADSNYCSFLTIDNLSLEQSTGVSVLSQSRLSVYPNPADNSITVDLKQGTGTIVMKDVLGKTVSVHPPGSARAVLDISNLSAGVYFLYVQSNSWRAVVKVQKQ